MIYLAVALLTGVVLLARTALPLQAVVGTLGPVYFHLLMVGWVTQLIFGVVYWMFPKYSADRPRGSEGLGWATYVLLNTGLVLRAVAEPLVALRPGGGAGWALALSAVLQWLAGMGFVVNTWGRVKER